MNSVRDRSGSLEDVRIHDLRHSYASTALPQGESLPMSGRMLGHREIETIGQCVYLARDSAHDTAASVANSIPEDGL